MSRRSSYQLRPPPKEVFPEATHGPGGLQATTLFWDVGILFHKGSHAGARVGNRFEVFDCIMTHVSDRLNAPPNTSYWRRIPTPGSLFSLSDPTATFTSTPYRGGAHRGHRRIHSSPRNYTPQTPSPPSSSGAADYFSQGHAHVPIRHEPDQLASAESAMHHASEAGLGPAQNDMSPGSSVDGQAGYYRAAGHPSAPMLSLAAPLENATLHFTGHNRRGVGGRRNSTIDTADSLGAAPAAQRWRQPTCKQEEAAAHRNTMQAQERAMPS